MRVRAQDQNGDYLFGRSALNFLVNSPAAVAQLIKTGLLLQQGEWFLDVTAGVPYSTEIIGIGTKSLYDLAIQTAILDVPGVVQIIQGTYSSSVIPGIPRSLQIQCSVLTQFSSTPVPINVVV